MAQRYGATIFGKLPESISWDFINYFWGAGAELLDPTFHPTVNSPEGVNGLTYFTDLLNKYKVVPPGSATYEYPEVLAAFQQDKAAMVLQWNAAYQSFADCSQSPLICDKFAVTVVPGQKQADGTINRGISAMYGDLSWIPLPPTRKPHMTSWSYLTGKEGLQLLPR